jgi:hypothetical protein
MPGQDLQHLRYTLIGYWSLDCGTGSGMIRVPDW